MSSRLAAASCALALGIACLMPIPGAPRAETVQDSASAKALLGDILEYVTELIASADEGSTLKMAGQAGAQPAGNKVEMLFPAPSIVRPDGSGVELDNVTATVTPQQKDHFDFTVGLPDSVRFLDTGGKSEGRMSWRESALRGTWRADLETATILHGALKKVRLTDESADETQLFGTIGSISIDQELVESANGWWSGPFALNVTNLDIAPPAEDEQLSLARIALSGQVQDFDLAGWQALSEWGSTISIGGDGTGVNPVGDGPTAARIFEAINLGAGHMGLTISDLSFGPSGNHQFRMGDLSLTARYDNGKRPGAYSVTVIWRELEDTNSDISSAFFTHTGSLKLHLEKFPIRQMLTTTLRQSAALDPSGENELGDGFQGMLLPLIYANQTSLRIEELVLESSTATLTASGNLSALNGSALGAVGDAKMEVTGLDKLIVAAARQALRGENVKNLMAFLTLAKGLGRPEVGADGKVVYVFDIVLPMDGIVTINEIPLDLLQDNGLTALPGREVQS